MITQLNARLVLKHDLEVNWLAAVDFVPLRGEPIIYDAEIGEDGETLTLPTGRTKPYTYARFKIGDGITKVTELPFSTEYEDGSDNLQLESTQVYHYDSLLSGLLDDYMLNIDYDVIAFDTSELVFETSTRAILGQAMLGRIVLG